MKPFRQFSILLNKYFLLRRRQPTLLLLEVLWPVLVFMIVAIIRMGVPPFKLAKCQYPGRDMPSAGLVPFMQSFVCNLNNWCETKDSSSNVMSAKTSMEKLAQEFSTLVNNPDAENALDSVNDVEKLITALDKTKEKQFREVLENGIYIGDLFKDPREIKRILADELGVFSESTVDALLKSKINMFEILSLTGYVDLKGIACNGTLLKSYIVFPLKTNISEVAHSLCNIDSASIPNITEMVQKQLNMVRILKKVSALMDPYEWSEGIGDLGKMIEVIMKMPSANNLVRDIVSMTNLTKFLENLPKYISTIQTYEQKQIGSSVEIFRLFEPFLTLAANNKTRKSLDLLKNGLAIIEKSLATKKIQLDFDTSDMELNLGSLFNNATKMEIFLAQSLHIDEKLIHKILNQTVNIDKLLNLLPLHLNASISMFMCHTPGISSFMSEPKLAWKTTNGTKTLQEILCHNSINWDQINQFTSISDFQQKLNDVTVLQKVLNILNTVIGAIDNSKEIPSDVNRLLHTLTQANISRIVTPLLLLANGSDLYENTMNIAQYVYENSKSLSGYNPAVSTAEKFVQLASVMLKMATELPNFLKDTSNNSLSTLFTKLYKFGPNVTQTILTELTDPEIIKVFLENNHNVSHVLCNSRFLQVRDNKVQHPFCTPHDVQVVQDVLAKLPLDTVESMFQDFFTALSKMIGPSAKHRQKRDLRDLVAAANLERNIPTLNSIDQPSIPANLTILFEGLDSIYQSLTKLLSESSMSWAQVFVASSPDNLKFLMKAPLDDHYIISSFFAYILEWGPKLESSPAWIFLGPVLKGGHVLIEKMNYQFARLKDLGVDSSQYISQLIDLLGYMLQYGPDFLPGVLRVMENPQMLASLKVESHDIVGMLCSDQQFFKILQLPSHVPIDRFQSIVCQSNLTLLILQTTSYIEFLPVFSRWLYSGHSISINWSKLVSDTKLWIETLPTVLRPEDMKRLKEFLTLSPADKTKLMHKLAVVMNNTNNELTTDMLVDRGIEFGKFLEESFLIPIEMKQEIKYYIFVFNIYLDITTEYLTLQKDNLTSTMVPSAQILMQILNETMSLPNEVLQIFQNSYINYEEIFVRLMSENAHNKRICVDLRLSDVLVFPPEFTKPLVYKYENYLCQLNWTAVADQLANHPATKKISQAIHYLGNNPNLNIKLDWTELAKKTKYTIKMWPRLTKILQDSYFGTFYNFFLTDQSVLQRLQLDESILTDNRKLENAINETLIVVRSMLKSFIPAEDLIYISNNLKIIEEMIRFLFQLDMNNQEKIFLQELLNDQELMNLLGSIKLSPDTVNTLFRVVIQLAKDPQSTLKALMKTSNWKKICADQAAFSKLFGKELGIQENLSSLRTTLCKDLLTANLTRLLEKLGQHLPGFDPMAKSISQIVGNSVANTEAVSTSHIVNQLTSLNSLTASIPRLTTSLSKDTNMNFNDLMSQLQQAVTKDTPGIENQIMNITVAIMENIMPLIKVPEEMTTVMNSANNFLVKFEMVLPDKKDGAIEMKKMFANQPEMLTMYNQIVDMPEAVSTLLFNVITNTDNDKFVNVINSGSMAEMGEKMCNLANRQSFAKIGCSSFDLNRLIRRMCEMNYAAMEQEMMSLFAANNIQPASIQLNAIEKPMDIKPLMTSIQQVWKKMDLLDSNPRKMWKPIDLWMNKMPIIMAMKDEIIRLAPRIFPLSSVKYMEDVFGMMGKMMPSMKPVMESINEDLQFEYYIMKFVNLQLEKIQEKKAFVLTDFVATEELKNLFTLLENSPKTLILVQDTFVDIMKNTSKVSDFLLKENWMKVCNDTNLFSRMFATDRLAALGFPASAQQSTVCKDVLAQMNSLKLLADLTRVVPGLPELMSGIEKTFYPESKEKTDYVAVAEENVKFQKLLSDILSGPISFELGFNLNWMDSNTYLMVAQQFLTTAQSIIENINFKSLTGLFGFLESTSIIDIPAEANELKISLYVQQQIMKFLNLQLRKINGSSTFILTDYVKSEELNKFFRVVEFGPESPKLLFDVAFNVIQNQKKMALLFEPRTWLNLCNDKKIFSEVFVTNKLKSSTNLTELHHLVCNIVNAPIDLKKLLKELQDNVDGFKELYEAMMKVPQAYKDSSNLQVSYGSIVKETDHFQKLLSALFTKPPVFKIDKMSNWTMGINYNQLLQKIILQWNSLPITFMQNSYDTSLKMLEKWLLTNSNLIPKTSVYSINKMLLVQYYVLDFLNTQINDTRVDGLMQILKSFDMKKLFDSIQSSPQSINILLQTAMNIIQEPKKMLLLLDSKKWDVVCKNETVFREMFTSDIFKQTNNYAELQSIFCKDVLQKIDIRKLLQDLQSNKDFQQMYILVSDVLQSNLLQANHSAINLQQFLAVHIAFQNNVYSLNWNKILMLSNNPQKPQQLEVKGLPEGLAIIGQLWENVFTLLPDDLKRLLQEQYVQLLSMQKVLEVINSELEQLNGTSNLQDYFQLPTVMKLFELLEKTPQAANLLLNALWKTAIQHPNKLSLWLSADVWSSVCSNTTVFQEIFAPSKNLTNAQSTICGDVLSNLNLTTLIKELSQSIDGLPQLLNDLYKLNQFNVSATPVNVNFTVLVATLEKFQKLIDDNLSNFKPEVWQDLMSYLGSVKLMQVKWSAFMTDFDLDSTLKALGSIGDLLKTITHNDLSTSLGQLIFANEQSLLTQYYVTEFLNLHLEKINGTKKFVLLDYVNSIELRKMFELLEEMPNAVNVLLQTLLRWNNKQQEFQKLLETVKWDKVCTDSTLFNKIFATDILGNEKAEFQSTVCNRFLLQGDFSKLMYELNKNVEGFSKLYSSIEKLYSTNSSMGGLKINFENIVSAQSKIQDLISSLIMNPPVFEIGIDNSWMNETSYRKGIEMFIATLQTTQLDFTKASESAILTYIGKMLDDVISNIPMDNPVMVQLKLQVLEQIYFYEFINMHLEKMNATKKFALLDFMNSTDVNKLLKLVEKTPEVVNVLLQTILRWSNRQQEFTQLLGTVKWEKLCTNSTLFDKIFATDILAKDKASQLQASFCDSDLLHIDWQNVFGRIDGLMTFISSIEQLYNQSFPLDQVNLNFTSYLSAEMKNIKLIESLMRDPPMVDIGINNNWMNESLYMKSIETFIQELQKTQLDFTNASLQSTADIMKFISRFNKEMLPTSALKQLVQTNQNFVILQSLLELINPVLKNITETPQSNVFEMTGSLEMVQILSLLQVSPDSVYVLLEMALKVFQHPQKILPWLQHETWQNICDPSSSDLLMSSLLGNISISEIPKEIKLIRTLLCSSFNQNDTNTETLIDHFFALPGFSKFYHLISTNASTMTVNATALFAELEQFQASMLSLAVKPPVLNWNLEKILLDNDTPLLKILDKWNKEMLSLNASSIVSRLKAVDELLSQQLPSSVASRFQMAKQYLLIQQKIIEILNQPLKQINETGEFVLMDNIKSEELKKIISLVLDSPGMINLLLETSLQLLNDYQEISSISNPGTWQDICDDPQRLNKVFKQSVDTYYYVNLTQLQYTLCNELNITKLWIELQQIYDPNGQLTRLLTSAQNVTIDYAALTREVMLYQDLLMSLALKRPTFKITKDKTWSDEELVFHRLVESFVNATKMQPQINSTNILIMLLSGVQPVILATNNSTEWKMFVKTIMDSLNALDMVLNNISGLPSELDKLLVGYPEMNKMVYLIKNSPEAVSTFVYNALTQTSKIIDAIQNASTLNSLCTTIQKVKMIAPPGATLNMNLYLQKLCAINFNLIEAEIHNITASLGRMKRDVSDQQNFEMLLKKLESLWTKLSALPSPESSAFYEPLITWANVTFVQTVKLEELLRILNQPETLDRLFQSTLNLLPALMDVETLRPSYHLLQILLRGSNDTFDIYSALIRDIWRNVSKVEDMIHQISADSVSSFIENNVKPFLNQVLKMYNVSEKSFPISKAPIGKTVSEIWKMIESSANHNGHNESTDITKFLMTIQRFISNRQGNLTRQWLHLLAVPKPIINVISPQALQQLKPQTNGVEHILNMVQSAKTKAETKSSNSDVTQKILKSMTHNSPVSASFQNVLTSLVQSSAEHRSGNNAQLNLRDLLTGSVNTQTIMKQMLNKQNFNIFNAVSKDPMQIFGIHLKSMACQATKPKNGSILPGINKVHHFMCENEVITLGYQQALAMLTVFKLPPDLLSSVGLNNASLFQQELWTYTQNIFGGLNDSATARIFNESQLYQMCEVGLPNSGLSATMKTYLGFAELVSDILINQNNIIPDVEKLLCDNSKDDVVRVLHILQQSDLMKSLEKFKESILNNRAPNHTCNHLAHLASKIPEEYNRIMKMLEDPTKTVKCLRRRIPRFAELVTNVDLMMHVTAEMLEIIQDPSFQALVNNQKLAPFIAVFLNTILQNKPVIVHLSQLFNDSSLVEKYLLHNTSLTHDVIQTLLNSSINIKLVQIIEKSPENMETILCNPSNLLQYIQWPGSEESLQNVTNILCSNFSATTSGLKIYLDLLLITQELSQLNKSINIDLAWLMNISKDMADLIKNIQRLFTLEGLFDSFNFDRLSELIPEIQRLAIDNVPEKIVIGVAQIINDFRAVENNSFSEELIEDVKVVMKGILGLRAVEKIMALSAVFKDFLKSPNSVVQYLTKDLEVPRNISIALIDSTVSLAQFIHLQSSSFSDLLCFNLSQVLTLPNNTNITYEDISEHLCHLDRDKVSNLTQLIMEQLKIGQLVKQYVLLQAQVILTDSNMTVPSAKSSFKSVSKTSSLIQKMSTSLSTTDVYRVFSNYVKDEGVDYNAFAKIVPMMCGRNVSLLVSDHFKLSGLSTENEIKGDDGLTHMQRQEIKTLPNEFCQHLYKDMIKTPMGEITWKFLKPLIRGKILFTPDNEITRSVIYKIDKIFQVVDRLQQVGAQWRKGLSGVSNVKDKMSSMADLAKYLKTPFVQDMLRDMFDLEVNELMEGIKMLDYFNNSTLSKLQHLVVNAINYTSCMSSNRFIPVRPDILEEYAYKLSKTNEFLAAIIFKDIPEEAENSRKKRSTSAKLPKHVKYEIRMDVDNVPYTGKLKERYWRPQPEDSFATEMRYFRGFIQLQDMIDRAIIETQIEESGINFSLPGVELKQFPFPCHMKDEYLHILSSYLMPIMMTLAWLASLGLGIRNFVRDRQGGQEEALLVMGMYSSVNWLAWMVSTMLMMSFVCILIVFILHFSTIFSYSNMLIMFLYFFIYCFSTTMMCYMVSSFFTHPTLAVLTGLIFYLFSYMPYVLLQSVDNRDHVWQIISSFSSTTAFSYGSLYLSTYEEQLRGIQWDNINTSPIEGDTMNFAVACMMMLIDSVLYFIIGWYVKNTKKRKYGIPGPWNFPCTTKYWGCTKNTSLKYDTTTTNNSMYASTEMLLEPPSNMNSVGISLINLSKKYKDYTAVNNLCLDFFKGEITTLLGQNGAGKTTTFNMMTGIMEATCGEVIYCNSEKSKNSSWLGICPQQNTLFDYMTAEEHIRLYAGIKAGLTGKHLEKEVRRILKDVDLLHMRNVPAKQLSGGMQRRLCVALAFTGKSKIVILDEPTAGVDPSARRGIWDLILKYRAGCTVILSTHHLDEADILSDRIAILHKGKVLCSGSSLFLKRHLGTGYNLTLIKNNPEDEDSPDSQNSPVPFSTPKVLDFVREHIPGSEMTGNFAMEATYTLPIGSAREKFSLLFENLDDNMTNLGVKSYGISDTTLEEVFMKARDLSDAGIVLTADNMKSKKTEISSPEPEEQITEANPHDITASSSDFQLNAPRVLPRLLDTFNALLMKRAFHYYRNWKLLFSFILLPCLFFSFAIGFSKIASSHPHNNLRLSPELYGKDTYAFYKDEANDAFGNELKDSFSKYPGIGTCCMAHSKENYRKICVPAETGFRRPYYREDLVNKSGACTCVDFRYDCPEYSAGIPPAQILLNSSVILQDLNSKKQSVVQYLLDSYPRFIKKRYGGWTYNKEENKKKSVTVWFNNKGHHALPAFFNGYSNAILRMAVKATNLGNPAEYGITVYNNPLKLSLGALSEESILQHASETAVSLVILLAFSFIPAGFAIYLVKENCNTEKHLLYISGVRPITYWVAAFFWDMVAYCVPLLIATIILCIFKLETFWARQNLPAAILLLFMFGWSAIPFMYTLVSYFKDTTTAYMIVFCLNVFIGMSTSIGVFLLSLFQGTVVLHTMYMICKSAFLVFPQFCMSYGLVSLGNNQLKTDIFAHFGKDVYEDPFHLLRWHFVGLAVSGVVFFMITLIIEYKHICTSKSRSKINFNQIYKEDEDVQHERMRAERNYQQGEDAISVVRLTKIYQHGLEKILAVKKISFGVKHGECFGLLGVNGAGKTSTFRMLTGEMLSSSGDVFMFGESLRRNPRTARNAMGYCPQEDALDSFLTGRELLNFHAKLRGHSNSEMSSIISQLISELHLENFANKLVSSYSGGMKRKLSLAIALLGDPPLVLLDEPTAGMDPGARRHVWNCVNRALRKGQSVILTSHSMEECDSLCTRLCIMVNGQFKCLGSPQHLKNKFSKGYTVTINMNNANLDITIINNFMRNNFPGTLLKESHNTTLVFSIPKSVAKVSKLFALLEQHKENLGIKDYALSQTTLDMVFVGFANEQSDGIIDRRGSVESGYDDTDSSAYDNIAFKDGSQVFENASLKFDIFNLETSHL